MRAEPEQVDKFLSIAETTKQTSLGKSCIYALVKRGGFPSPRQLTRGRVGWMQSEVSAWINSRPSVNLAA